MMITSQRRLAGSVMGVSEKRVWFDEARIAEIKEAITKADIRVLIQKGLIGMRPEKGVSKGRTRHSAAQKVKGRRTGHGRREGKSGGRIYQKGVWMNKIRLLRSFLKELKDKQMLSSENYRELYLKAKGGFFRSVRHLKLHLNEHDLVLKPKK